MPLLDLMSGADFWVTALRVATPLLFGTLGALLGERAGVRNVGIEGIMVAGAFCGGFAAWLGAGLWGALLLAALLGALLGLLNGLLTVVLALSQPLAGLGLTLLATALASFGSRVSFARYATPPTITPFAPLGAESPLLDAIPVLAQITAPTLIALALVPVIGWLLYRTPFGLALRMSGENPDAVEAQGLSVSGIRLVAAAAGGALMALGGAVLTLAASGALAGGFAGALAGDIAGGRGWICLALVAVASWRPGPALIGTLLVGAVVALLAAPDATGAPTLPPQLTLMAPYLLAIAALALASRRAQVPQALMKPWRRSGR